MTNKAANKSNRNTGPRAGIMGRRQWRKRWAIQGGKGEKIDKVSVVGITHTGNTNDVHTFA